MSYSAIVARIYNIRPHPNAERLRLANCLSNQVIIGLTEQEGQLGLFFEPDGQLGEEFSKANDLIRRRNEQTGKMEGGYLESNRRIRVLKLRGERSEGLWLPLSSLEKLNLNLSSLSEGDEISTLQGVEICCKYETPATKQAKQRGEGKQGKEDNRRSTKWFPQHFDTKQLRHVLKNIPSPSVLWFTEKLHGTSCRFGYVLDDVKLPLWKRAINYLVLPYTLFPTREYTYLNGSRKVILGKNQGKGFYGTNTFRYAAIEGIELHKGEVLYGELVGWVNENTPIMPEQRIKGEEVAHLISQYGNIMKYTYGFPKGEVGLFIYRITSINEDGKAIEYSWEQVKARCGELGIKHVPEMMGPYVYTGNDRELSEVCDGLCQGPSLLSDFQMREGVCVRVEHTGNMNIYKKKSFEFLFLEGKGKDNSSLVDIEEAA